MSQPPAYTPSTDFSDEERDNVGGRSTVRTAALDAELSSIASTLSATLANLALNQRDDGEIRDSRVKLFSLASDVLALLTSYGATPRGAWLTATSYALKDLVSQSGNTYIAVSAHSSGVFATDLAAGKWLLFSLSAAPGATQVTFTPTATVSATNVQAAIQEVDTEYRAADTAIGLLITDLTTALAELIADLANTADTAKGDALVSVKQPFTGAVATTQHEVNARTISVADFMTAAQIADAQSRTNALDCSAAVQAAVDYCIASSLSLDVPYRLRLASTVNIDRAVDGAAFDCYFKISSKNGGGFYATTAIDMFSSTAPYTLYPVIQLVLFEGLTFETNNAALSTYVMSGPRFLRTTFDTCSFSKIRLATASTYYQSIYLLNCQARRWAGVFLNGTRTYDVQIIGGMYEGSGTGAQAFLVPNSTGLKLWTQIEGCTGTAVGAAGANGADISLYCEANGTSLDFSGGATTTGVNLHGSNFIDTGPSVIWGACSGCVSHGNYSSGTLHQLTASSQVDINDFAVVAVSNLDAVAHRGYREGAIAGLTIRGGTDADYTVSGLTARYSSIGRQVSVEFSATLTSTGTNAADTLFISAGIPQDAAAGAVLVGQCEVVGSSVNNGLSPLYLSSASPARVQSSINVIPANVATDSWTVRGFFTYTSAT